MENKKQKNKLSNLLTWLVSLLFLLGGMLTLEDSLLGGVLMILGAVFILPLTSRFLKAHYNIELSPWLKLALFVVLVISGIGLTFHEAPERGFDDTTISRVNQLIMEADQKTSDSFGDIHNKDFDSARKKSLEAKSKLEELQILMDDLNLSLDEKRHLKTFIEYEQRWSTLIYKTANVEELTSSVMERLDKGAKLKDILPELELIERGYRENAANWHEFADYVSSLKTFREQHEITDENVQVLYGVANMTVDFAEELATIINDLKREDSSYTPVTQRTIEPASLPSSQSSQLIPEELSRFFDSFDTNEDKKLSIGEAQEFYYWVENNIIYRYDDEGETKPIMGTLVGDGKNGTDYRQTPQETFEERAGDCEDMATLEQAFYRYYGIDAYVAGVNTEKPDVLDHATTIVWIADKTDLFRETLGDLLYYEISEGNHDIYGNPIKPGVYMLVDNAYSDVLGYLSGGIAPGTFRIYCTIPLDQGYEDWNDVVDLCGVPMD